MKLTKDNLDTDFDSIPIEPFWNTSDKKESKIHRIHSYPAKFPAFITTKAIEHAEKEGVNVNLVADIFCGCGTTAYEATRNGKDFWGCDINPVATLIAKTKSQQYSNEKLEQYFNKIRTNFFQYSINIKEIREINKKINSSFVDLIVTSPPYVTSYEYADLHQLSTLWLDFAEDYRSLREGTIGSLYHNSNFTEDIKELNKTGEKIVFQLYNYDKRKAKSAAKYFVDIQKSVYKAFDILNRNSLVFFVIGNTEYKSVRIDNAKHLVESMMLAGFEDIEVTKRKISKKILTPYRDNKGKFTSNKNSRKVYAEEFIIIGAKK